LNIKADTVSEEDLIVAGVEALKDSAIVCAKEISGPARVKAGCPQYSSHEDRRLHRGRRDHRQIAGMR